MSARSASLTFVLLSLAASACAVSDAAPAAAPTASAPAPASAAPNTCVQVMTRARTCSAQWIPALVDARARVDIPAGITAEVRSDRAGVIAQANAEWATDSQDANLAATCSNIEARTTPGERAEGTACLAKPDCDTYVACVIPLFERRMGQPHP